jgi:hypothetical protein
MEQSAGHQVLMADLNRTRRVERITDVINAFFALEESQLLVGSARDSLLSEQKGADRRGS